MPVGICDSRLMSLFMLLSVILQFSHLSCYSVSYICSCSYYYLCTLFSARVVPFTHTHSPWSRSDDPGFARPDIGRLFPLCRCSMRLYDLRGTGLSLFWFWYSFLFLFLLLFFDSCISPLASILFLISFQILYSLICIIAVTYDYVLIYSLFRLI